MTGGILGFLLLAVLVPVLVGEARDLAPFLAAWLLRWGARHVGQAGQARRYEEEWLADLGRVPGKATKLVHACSVVALSVPRLRRNARGTVLPGWTAARADGQLAPEVDASLQRVAGMLVPRFADHVFIDLFQCGVLIRRVQRHAGGWEPPPGSWAQVGERIRYPEGHFCQRAMARLETVLIPDLPQAEQSSWAPSALSLAVSRQVGVTSTLTAPLYARGTLLGVMSLATSGLTGRTERFGPDDQDLVAVAAARISAVIDASAGTGLHDSARTWVGPRSGPEQQWVRLGAHPA